MRIRKTILKTCAVLMAAAIMASPVTVRAGNIRLPDDTLCDFGDENAIPADTVNGIAQRGILYKMPSYDWSSESGEIAPGELRLVFFDDGYDFDFGRAVPAGYKKVTIEAGYEWLGNDGSYSYYEIPSRSWYLDAENSSQDWPSVEWNFDNYNCAGYVQMNNFTVDCGGVTYPECWVVIGDIEMGVLHAEAVVPQQYDGAIYLTIYGMKNENGKLTQNDASYITAYLQGGSGLAADTQPAEPAAEPTPAADLQLAVPNQQPVTTDKQGTTYVTKSGDSLMKIAKELYGDKDMWTSIYEMNKGIIKNPNVIFANMQLVLP